MQKLSVRERALRAVVQQLELIQVPDYNFSIRHVRRQRYIPELADDPPEIHLMFGRNRIQYREANGASVWNYLPTQIWFYSAERNILPDTVSNMILGDVQKVLAPFKVYDTTGTPPAGTVGREVQCEAFDDEPLYSEVRDGQIVTRMFYTVKYSYLQDDPFLWDTCDSYVYL